MKKLIIWLAKKFDVSIEKVLLTDVIEGSVTVNGNLRVNGELYVKGEVTAFNYLYVLDEMEKKKLNEK